MDDNILTQSLGITGLLANLNDGSSSIEKVSTDEIKQLNIELVENMVISIENLCQYEEEMRQLQRKYRFLNNKRKELLECYFDDYPELILLLNNKPLFLKNKYLFESIMKIRLQEFIVKNSIEIDTLESFTNEIFTNLNKMPYAEYLKSYHWQITKKIKLIESEHSCELCNAEGKIYDNGGWEPKLIRDGVELHVHHKTYKRRGYERLSDLIVLCKDCHAKIHGKESKE